MKEKTADALIDSYGEMINSENENERRRGLRLLVQDVERTTIDRAYRAAQDAASNIRSIGRGEA